MSDQNNQAQEKAAFEIDILRQKLKIKEKELKIKEKELEDLETGKTRKLDPLIVGIVAALISFLAAMGTAWFGLKPQAEQARSQFEIKAAEIVLQTRSPGEASDKAIVLKELFPNRLPENFAQSFNPEKFLSYSPDIISEKLELLKILQGKKIAEMKDLVRLWILLYPEDTAGPKILAALETQSSLGNHDTHSDGK